MDKFKSLSLHGILFNLIVLAVYCTIHSFAVQAPFAHGDDPMEVAFVNGFSSWYDWLGPDVFGLFRPIKNLLFLIFSRLSGLGMPICRLFAILIGVASYFPVLALMRRLLLRPWLACLATGIWLLSPTLMSSVAWLSCVNIQVMCAFAALAFVCHMNGKPVKAGCWLALALVSYEQAVAVGPILVAYDFFLRPDRFRARGSRKTYLVYAFVTLVYLLLRSACGASTELNGNFYGIERWDLSLASVYFMLQHFGIWLWPFGKFAVFGAYTKGLIPLWWIISCWAIVTACVVLVFKLRRSFPLVVFSMTLAGLSFLPVSNVLGFGNGPYGDYYMGIPSMGLVLLWACLTNAACERTSRVSRLLAVLSVLFVCERVCSIGESVAWVRLWGDELEAYKANAHTFPKAFCVRIVLARELCDAGFYDEAVEQCHKAEALMDMPGDAEKKVGIYHILAVGAMRWRNDADQALSYLEKARQLGKGKSGGRFYHYFRGCIMEDCLNDVVSAEREYAMARSDRRRSMDGDDVDIDNRYARLLALRGELAQAVSLLENAARIDPSNATVAQNLRTVRRLLGRE